MKVRKFIIICSILVGVVLYCLTTFSSNASIQFYSDFSEIDSLPEKYSHGIVYWTDHTEIIDISGKRFRDGERDTSNGENGNYLGRDIHEYTFEMESRQGITNSPPTTSIPQDPSGE